MSSDLDFYGSLSSERAVIRAREREMRARGYSEADVRTEALRAEAALLAPENTFRKD